MEEDTFAIVWHGYSRVDCECRRLGHDDCQIIDQFKVTWLERLVEARRSREKFVGERKLRWWSHGAIVFLSLLFLSLFRSIRSLLSPFLFFFCLLDSASPGRSLSTTRLRVVNMIDSFRFRTTVKRGAKRRWSVFGASAALIGIGNARGWVDRDGTKRNERMWWKGWREGGPSCEMMFGWLFLARARRISCWNKGFVTEFWFCRGNWLLHVALFLIRFACLIYLYTVILCIKKMFFISAYHGVIKIPW